MFAKKLVTQSMIDAVNQVLGEAETETKQQVLLDEEKKRMLLEPELDETGFHKAAHAAKKAGQSHFEFQGKKYPVTTKSHAEALAMEAAEKVPTSTGMKVYGSSYGNSAKARKDQTKHSVDDVKGPKTKELKAMDKEPKRNLDEAGDCVTEPEAKKIAKKEVKHHNVTMHKGQKNTVKAESYFTNKLLNSLNEAKSTGTEEIFSDNNMGEEKMSDAQMKKREKIVMSMKKGEAGLKQRYGKNWKNVMYATATKQAMKEDSSDVWEGEELDEDNKKVPNLPIDNKGIDKHYGGSVVKMAAAAKKSGFSDARIRKTGLDYLNRKEDVELDEATPSKNTDIADKAYLKHKPGTVKGTMTQLGRFLRGKPEIKEETVEEGNKSHTHAAHYENEKGEWTGMNLLTAKDDEDAIKQAHEKCKDGCRLSRVERHIPVKESVEVVSDKAAKKITTDMLSGRVEGGKLNGFKNFKVNLVTSGEETIPKETDEGEDTKEKQKITTNPGPVDVKLDDKLTGPTPYTHFSSEHQITHEQVQVAEKVIAGTPGWKKMPKDVKDKSGAVHTPMSRARDLARKSFKKLKKETMMGKISN